MTTVGQKHVRKSRSMMIVASLLCMALAISSVLPDAQDRWMMLVWTMFPTVSALVALICVQLYADCSQSRVRTGRADRHRLRYGLAGFMIAIALVCLVLAISQRVPVDGQDWVLVTSPLFLSFAALAVATKSPWQTMLAFALSHGLFATLYFIWASMTNDGVLSLIRFIPVLWSDIHLALMLEWFGMSQSIGSWILLSVVGTGWWAGVGYLVGLAKLAVRPSPEST
jgi:hypothetical protein